MDFLSGSKWYFDRGIPYRRGYLLHGPPGCGKSSYVMAVAGQLKYNICVLNVGDPYLTDDRLIYLISTVPPASILLLEDIDGAVTADGHDAVIPPQKMKSAKHSTRQASFSGLLNALDGVAATEEKIIFMTTNFLNCLPEALIRPGRVDMKIRIGYATHHQIQQMFERFFPDQSAELAEEFASLIYTMNISMAELQGFFLFCKDDPSKAFEMAYQWKQADETSRLEETEKSKETVTPT
ncbi:putative BCS1 family isoform 9 [Cardiosporidium cionae]|uniref:BCS1 family isoform 9 n=1 Tax=Cardiosporidium cionae TaxID=476202 RepID=A0ABQ7JE66_9APIC|nr:putative BCS1 family isoform 9 [Cardiosporidium cionae]|eukprot:KAF8822306.1 putative BCS1 family isoform 9 [Cardiosporidium cionae]